MALGVRTAAVAAVALVLTAGGCGDDPPPDGYSSIAEGDIYGEFELFAEFQDGEWTGCLRLEPVDEEGRCGDPESPALIYQTGDGITFGAVAEGEEIRFVDGDEIELIDGRFFVVADDTDVELAP